MADKIRISKGTVSALEPPQTGQVIYWDEDVTGFGVRVSPGGTRTYIFQGRLKGKLKKYTIGQSGKVTAAAARKEAKRVQSCLELKQDPYPETERETEAATFGQMMLGYSEWLAGEGKVSAEKVRREIEKDIQEPFPKLWRKPAHEIDIDDCDKILARLVRVKKPRQADKIRAYMKTAFRKAINARPNTGFPDGLRQAQVRRNPCADIEKIEGSSEARDRALTIREFRAYWRHAQNEPEPRRSLLMLHVLTGGQRLQQLARATLHDIDHDAGLMTIMDAKGRRKTPRRHLVPLLPEALACIGRLTGSGGHVFSCDGGKKPVSVTYMRDAVARVRNAMEAAGDIEKGHFTPGSIRASVETRLSAKPYLVSPVVLGYLLSHGLGGVQAKHYQHHDFIDEMRDALNLLALMLDTESNVVPLELRA